MSNDMFLKSDSLVDEEIENSNEQNKYVVEHTQASPLALETVSTNQLKEIMAKKRKNLL